MTSDGSYNKDCPFFINADAYGCDRYFPKWYTDKWYTGVVLHPRASKKIKDFCRLSCDNCLACDNWPFCGDGEVPDFGDGKNLILKLFT